MKQDEAPDARGKRGESEDPPPPTKQRTRPGRRFEKGNRAGVGHGRPKRDALLDLFFEQIIKGTTKDGQAIEVERRWALLERIYTSAMNVQSKDHVRLLELCAAYYFGKPRERLEMSGPGGGPIRSEDATSRRRPTTGELRKELDAILAKREAYLAKKAEAGETNGATNGANGVHEPEET